MRSRSVEGKKKGRVSWGGSDNEGRKKVKNRSSRMVKVGICSVGNINGESKR